MFDPNSPIPRAVEVRVTMRGVRLTADGSPVQVSTRSDFIAPELSGPSTLAIELDKGLRGWTDYDVELVDPRPLHLQRADKAREALEAERLAEYQCGVAIAKRPAAVRKVVVSRTGPRKGRGNRG